MHKAKQISKRVKNSRCNTYIQKEGPLDKTSYRPISIQLFQIFSKEFYLINYPAFQINFFASVLWIQESVDYSIRHYKPSPKWQKCLDAFQELLEHY